MLCDNLKRRRRQEKVKIFRVRVRNVRFGNDTSHQFQFNTMFCWLYCKNMYISREQNMFTTSLKNWTSSLSQFRLKTELTTAINCPR